MEEKGNKNNVIIIISLVFLISIFIALAVFFFSFSSPTLSLRKVADSQRFGFISNLISPSTNTNMSLSLVEHDGIESYLVSDLTVSENDTHFNIEHTINTTSYVAMETLVTGGIFNEASCNLVELFYQEDNLNFDCSNIVDRDKAFNDFKNFTSNGLRLTHSGMDKGFTNIGGAGSVIIPLNKSELGMGDTIEIGENSIVYTIITFSTAESIDTNITQENNFSHLDLQVQSGYGLVAYYPFDENVSSTTVYDFTQNDLDLDINNSPLYNSSCLYGGCWQFDHSNTDLLSVGDNAQLDISDAITLSAWIYIHNMTSGRLVNKGDASEFSYRISVLHNFGAFNNATVFQISSTGADAPIQIIVDDILPENQWQHWLGTFNGSTGTFYLDGVSIGSQNASPFNIFNSAAGLAIGADSDGGININASIDEVMIFNRSLNVTEVLEIYENRSARYEPRGSQIFRQFNFTEGDNTVNVTTNQFQENFDSNLDVRIGHWDLTRGYNDSVDGDVSPENLEGLRIYYHLDNRSDVGENSSHVFDFSGNQINGTWGGVEDDNSGFTENNSVYGEGLMFDGINDANDDIIRIGDIDFIDNMTIAMWINSRDILTSGTDTIIAKRAGSSQDGEWALEINYGSVNDGLTFSCGTGGRTTADDDIVKDQWNFIGLMASNSSDNLTFFVNGKTETLNLTGIDCLFDDTETLNIGQRGNSAFNGTMDEIMLFNRTLSILEMNELYVQGKALWNVSNYQNVTGQNNFSILNISTNLISEYRFDGGNQSNPFYTPILFPDITFDFFTEDAPAGDVVNPNINITSPTVNNTNSSDNGLDILYTRSDDVALDTCWYSNDTYTVNTTLAACANITTVTWSEGNHNVTIYVNDTSNNLNQSSISFTIDTTVPSFTTIPANATLELNISGLGVQFEASETVTWTIDDTSNFTINSTGGLSNATVLVNTTYIINVTINDTIGLINSTLYQVDVEDTLPPYFDEALVGQNLTEQQSLFYNINASDDGVGLNSFSVNDSTFSINSTGGLINSSGLSEKEYYINISINDNVDNINSSILLINVSGVDETNPDINITFPVVNNSNHSINTIEINYTRSDDVAIDSCWYSNDTYTVNTTLGSCANITGITWSDALHNLTIYVNDTSNNLNFSTISFRIDTTIPTFDNLANQTIEDNESLSYDIDATDTGIGLGTFAINWTSTFSINSATGVLTNTSGLGSEQIYWINVSVNDTLGNTAHGVIFVNVTNTSLPDTTPPTFDNLINHTHTGNTSFSYDLDATDPSGIDTFTLNDTSVFNISSTGLITNITNLSFVEIYWLNVTVNDTVGNEAYGVFFINVTAPGDNITMEIGFPLNGSIITLADLSLNITSTGAVQSFKYRLNDDPTNFTFTPNTTLSNLEADRFHIIQVWANNSAGEEVTDIKRFYIGVFSPQVYIYIFGYLLGITLVVFGKYRRKEYMIFLAGMLFLIIGIFFNINGLPLVNDTLFYQLIYLTSIGLGAFFIIDAWFAGEEDGDAN